MPKDQLLPKPNPEIVDKKIEEFNGENKDVEETLTSLIQRFPRNDVYEQILVKSEAINLLYSTWIVGISAVGRHISKLKIDPALDTGDTEIVDQMAQVPFKDKTRNEYSFATKYCSWHRPEGYPIWDSRVDECLWEYRGGRQNRDPFTGEPNPFPTFKHRSDLWNYTTFRQIMTEFRQRYHLESYTFKDTDKFLYLLGNEYFYPDVCLLNATTNPILQATALL